MPRLRRPHLPASSFYLRCKLSVQPRTADIPTSRLRRETTLLRLSLAALGIQQLARFRCLASPSATSTPLLALDRLILTPRTTIRPLAVPRSCLMPPVQKTQLSEQPHLNSTLPASKIQPAVSLLFLAM